MNKPHVDPKLSEIKAAKLKLKQDLEKAIDLALSEFHEKTKLPVEDIYVRLTTNLTVGDSNPRTVLADVCLDVRV